MIQAQCKQLCQKPKQNNLTIIDERNEATTHTIQTLLFRTHSVDGKNPVLQDFTVITHQYTLIACISTYLK